MTRLGRRACATVCWMATLRMATEAFGASVCVSILACPGEVHRAGCWGEDAAADALRMGERELLPGEVEVEETVWRGGKVEAEGADQRGGEAAVEETVRRGGEEVVME